MPRHHRPTGRPLTSRQLSLCRHFIRIISPNCITINHSSRRLKPPIRLMRTANKRTRTTLAANHQLGALVDSGEWLTADSLGVRVIHGAWRFTNSSGRTDRDSFSDSWFCLPTFCEWFMTCNSLSFFVCFFLVCVTHDSICSYILWMDKWFVTHDSWQLTDEWLTYDNSGSKN